MSDLVRISRRLYVGAYLDEDLELEVSVDEPQETSYAFLKRREIVALIAHLNKVLDDEDKKQETET